MQLKWMKKLDILDTHQNNKLQKLLKLNGKINNFNNSFSYSNSRNSINYSLIN